MPGYFPFYYPHYYILTYFSKDYNVSKMKSIYFNHPNDSIKRNLFQEFLKKTIIHLKGGFECLHVPIRRIWIGELFVLACCSRAFAAEEVLMPVLTAVHIPQWHFQSLSNFPRNVYSNKRNCEEHWPIRYLLVWNLNKKAPGMSFPFSLSIQDRYEFLSGTVVLQQGNWNLVYISWAVIAAFLKLWRPTFV